jgi:hypothetical protein
MPRRRLTINSQLHTFEHLDSASLPRPWLKIQSLLPAPGPQETCLTGDGNQQTLKEVVQRYLLPAPEPRNAQTLSGMMVQTLASLIAANIKQFLTMLTTQLLRKTAKSATTLTRTPPISLPVTTQDMTIVNPNVGLQPNTLVLLSGPRRSGRSSALRATLGTLTMPMTTTESLASTLSRQNAIPSGPPA